MAEIKVDAFGQHLDECLWGPGAEDSSRAQVVRGWNATSAGERAAPANCPRRVCQ